MIDVISFWLGFGICSVIFMCVDLIDIIRERGKLENVRDLK